VKDAGTGLLWLAGVVAALGAAVVMIGKGARLMRTTLKRLREFLDDWNGAPERPGHDRVPGVPERLKLIETRVHQIELQVNPNGGGSLRDTVDRIADAVSGEIHP
jgi:hypothetical protein